MKKLLILGVDPGTTIGYALLDLNGVAVQVKSSKQLSMSSLIFDTIREGKVVIIGTDKSKTPKFIEKMASKIGARIIKPTEDLKVEEKREFTKEYEFGNEHEKDAIASAVYAFKRVRKILTKADVYLRKHDKENINNEVKDTILKDNRVSIHEAVIMIEKKPELKENRRKRNKTGKTKEEEHIDEENGKEEEPRMLERRLELLKHNFRRIVKSKVKKTIRIKNQEIDSLTKKIIEQEKEIKKLNASIERLFDLLKKADKNLILKRLKNLSWEEVENKELEKIIYVDDPNIFSEKSAEKIRERVNLIVSRKEISKKVSEKFRVGFINANKVGVQEEGDIILINRDKLEKERSNIDIVKRIIEEYKETRK